MKVHKENKGQAQILLKRLKDEYKISQNDVAKWCRINRSAVAKWSTGQCVANTQHLDKMREALVLLAGRNIRYPKQALDILMGRE